jgi:hypothetical protein
MTTSTPSGNTSSRRRSRTALPPAILACLTALCSAGALEAQSSISTAGDMKTAGRLVSTSPSGPPLQVSSNALVAGLNSDLLDGLDAASFALGSDLADIAGLVAALQSTIADQEELIARLHPKLVLYDGRFRAWVTFEQGGVSQPAEPVPVGSDARPSGYFYFTRPFYADVFVRMLDARPINSAWWVFAAPLTELAYTLTVLDTETGNARTYVNPAGSRLTFFDTSAFPDTGGFPLRTNPARSRAVDAGRSVVRTSGAGAASCVADTDTLCLVDQRFQIEATFEASEMTFVAHVNDDLALSHTGAFFFFDSQVIELLVKVVEKPGEFVINVGLLTDVEHTITVTDTCTGASVDYIDLGNFGDDTSFPNVPCTP